MKVWIDIANAPHATLFAPVAAVLRERGHELLVTAWDRGQARDLALAEWPDATLVGDPGYRRPVIGKATAIWDRAARLAHAVRDARPDVVVGHNSYSQIVAGRRLRLPVITMMDYEHQPANHLAFRLAHRVVLPEAIPDGAVRRFGLRPNRIVRYAGFKEEIALARFRPEPGFHAQLGVGADEPLAVVRTAAEGALYHRHGNDLIREVLDRLASTGARVLLSPRTETQAEAYAAVPGVEVLRRTVSGPDLLFAADLVVGAGGTMTREAAILGSPVWSMFAGKPAAVDDALVRAGRLQVLHDAAELPSTIARRDPRWEPPTAAVTVMAELLLATAGTLGAGR